MRYKNTILETVGATPLVKLNKIVAGLEPLILAKVEAFNPGGSIKDRPALAMIEEAEKQGLLRPGGTIVEPTSGNTGTGLAQIAAVKGYRCILVVPDKVAVEKINLLKAYGAKLSLYQLQYQLALMKAITRSQQIDHGNPRAFQPNQFANPFNPQSHYDTTDRKSGKPPMAR
jgi:cystathionine beta-synthase